MINIDQSHTLTDGEIDNIVYLCCKYGVGWDMRGADLAVIKMMSGTPLIGPAGMAKLLDETAAYLWDHIMGEPDDPTQAQVRQALEQIIETWWNQTPEAERSKTD
jgi:hypothetical protein